MKKILMVLLAICLFSTVALAGERKLIIRDDEGLQFEDLSMYGLSISSGTSEGMQVIGTGDVLIYDIFVVCSTTGTYGAVTLYNTALSELVALDVPPVVVTLGSKSRSICPWAQTGLPARFEAGLNVQAVEAGGETITVYVLYID